MRRNLVFGAKAFHVWIVFSLPHTGITGNSAHSRSEAEKMHAEVKYPHIVPLCCYDNVTGWCNRLVVGVTGYIVTGWFHWHRKVLRNVVHSKRSSLKVHCHPSDCPVFWWWETCAFHRPIGIVSRAWKQNLAYCSGRVKGIAAEHAVFWVQCDCLRLDQSAGLYAHPDQTSATNGASQGVKWGGWERLSHIERWTRTPWMGLARQQSWGKYKPYSWSICSAPELGHKLTSLPFRAWTMNNNKNAWHETI